MRQENIGGGDDDDDKNLQNAARSSEDSAAWRSDESDPLETRSDREFRLETFAVEKGEYLRRNRRKAPPLQWPDRPRRRRRRRRRRRLLLLLLLRRERRDPGGRI